MRSGSCASLVCVMTLLAAPAAAQPTTEDGIRAVVRGDYQAAARILRPLVGDTARPDPVAEFFLALVYHNPRGGYFDQLRACGLFLRSASRPHPFAEQSAALAGYLQQQLQGGAPLCIAEERWGGGPPQSFVLGPDHRIVFADTSITLLYGDREERSLIRMPLEAAPLPIRYTPVDVTRPEAARRHFLHWFLWKPDRAGTAASWTLDWALLEVAGDKWAIVKHETAIAAANGSRPPEDYDVTKLIRVAVSASGEAELVVIGGSTPRTEVIPPGERR